MKNLTSSSSLFSPRLARAAALSVCASAVLGIFAGNAKAAIIWWDPNGTTSLGGNSTWNTTTKQWSTATTQVASSALIVWNSADAAGFCAGPTGSAFQGTFTVTVNSAINCPGIFNGSQNPAPCSVTLTGTGSLNLPTGAAGFSTFAGTGGATIINIPVTGVGPLEPESSGQLYLNATNTYTGGTLLGGTGIVNFNNMGSFGTGTITMQTGGGAFVAEGSAPITITNAWTAASVSLNLVGNAAGVTYSGNWSLGSTTPQIASSSSSVKSLDILSGVISGTTGGFTAWSTAGGTIQFNNAMTYTGATTASNLIVLTLGPSGGIGKSAVTIQTNATLADTNVSGSNALLGALTFQASGGTGRAAAKAIFNGTSNSIGQITVASNLTLNSTPIVLNVQGTAMVVGSYRLISCSGTVSGSAATPPTITGTALPAGYVAKVVTTTGAGGHVDLLIDSPPVPGAFSLGAVQGVSVSVPTAKILSVATSAGVSGPLTITNVTSPTAGGATVTLGGGNLTYLSTNLGADSITYTLSDGTASATGTIDVTVSANGTSDNGLVASPSGPDLSVSAYGIPGQLYYIQQSTNAPGLPPWTTVATNTANSLGQINATIPGPIPSPSFYRTSTTP